MSMGVQSINASHLQMVSPFLMANSSIKDSALVGPAEKFPTAKDLPIVKYSSIVGAKDPLIVRRIWWDDYGQHYSGTVAPLDDKRKGTHMSAI
jgi:hypothetical protein